jgi:hypothetical protein
VVLKVGVVANLTFVWLFSAKVNGCSSREDALKQYSNVRNWLCFIQIESVQTERLELRDGDLLPGENEKFGERTPLLWETED